MSKNDEISDLVSDKLDKNNFHAWKFRMTNFLMGKGYWDYIDGDQEKMPKLPADVNPTADQIKAFKDWNQGAKKVMYWMFVSVQDTIIGHIQDATSPKQAWERTERSRNAKDSRLKGFSKSVCVSTTWGWGGGRYCKVPAANVRATCLITYGPVSSDPAPRNHSVMLLTWIAYMGRRAATRFVAEYADIV
ncbi:hypothetical protein L7F22_049366 [Adiantum nelumboides]|nr:hypothetical protein [Adiantum nelumboides]